VKKTPILLSTMVLTVSSLGATLPVVAADTNQLKDESGVLSNDPLSGDNLSLLPMNSSKDVIFLGGKEQNPFFHLLSVDYKNNQLGIRMYEQDDWRIKRVVLAYRNFEGGISEAEADQQLSTLGVTDSTAWKMLWDYDAKGVKDLYFYMAPKEGNKNIPLGENLTDIVYYAVEYGHKTDMGWQDNWWTRGKISYRNCVHSAIFDPETMICTEESDGSYSIKTAKYVMVAKPEEEVISWDEEWNAILRKRYGEARDQLANLRNYLYNTVTILDGADLSLGNLVVTLPKAEGMENRDEMVSDVARLQDLSRTLREYYANLGNSGNSAEKAELEQLRQEADGLRLENESLATAKSQVEQENAGLRRQIAMLEEEKTDEVAGSATTENVALSEPEANQERAEELVATTETKIVVVERGKDETQNVEAQGKEVAEVQGVRDADEDTANIADTVTVPNLGDLEEETNLNRWWILAAGVGFLAGLEVILSRLVRRKNQNKHE